MTPNFISYSQSKILKDYVLKILLIFIEQFFLKKLFKKYSQKGGFWGTNPLHIHPFWSEL